MDSSVTLYPEPMAFMRLLDTVDGDINLADISGFSQRITWNLGKGFCLVWKNSASVRPRFREQSCLEKRGAIKKNIF